MSRRRERADAAVPVTADLLRGWGLPDPGESKKSRGDVLVVGGSRRTPGGVVLAGEAALRVGAGRLAVLAPRSIDAQLGAVLPEAAILALPDDPRDPLGEGPRIRVGGADAVLFGPGFDDADETLATLVAVIDARPSGLVLDAFGLGVLPRTDRSRIPDRLVLTPNREELALLRDAEPSGDERADVREAARRHRAVVTCYGTIADPDGRVWTISAGGPGLGTAGSGDVRSGAIAGFLARGLDPVRAAVWGTWVHARAGDALTARLGLGILAREIAGALPAALAEAAPGVSRPRRRRRPAGS